MKEDTLKELYILFGRQQDTCKFPRIDSTSGSVNSITV